MYDGVITQKVREQFYELTRKVVGQFLNDQINDRLRSAMSGAIQPSLAVACAFGAGNADNDDAEAEDDKMLTSYAASCSSNVGQGGFRAKCPCFRSWALSRTEGAQPQVLTNQRAWRLPRQLKLLSASKSKSIE